MKTLRHFRNFVDEIMRSNSRIYKQEVLKKYADDEVIKRYLQIAFDPYRVYGISEKKLAKEVHVGDVECMLTVFDLFDYLETHNTGRDYDIAVCQLALDWIASDDIFLAETLETLICKGLSIGVDSKTINSVIPDLIPTFSVQLANKYFDKPQYLEGKKFAITTKIDGGRIIALKENGQVSFFTRAGQKYEGLVDLEDEMSRLMPDNTCLDGEITLLTRSNRSSKECYKETMKIVRTKDKEKHGIKMLVFDWMPAEDFKKQQCDQPYRLRRAYVDQMFNMIDFRYFDLLPLLYVGEDTSKITEILEEEVANGEEGIMLNEYDALYEFKRTNSLLKCKKFDSLDLEVVGVEEGSGRLAGTLGAIKVRYKGGNIVKVGAGFSDEERKLYWNRPELLIGHVVEIKYFEFSKNADGGESLRFPTWCSNIRTDKLEPDF